MGVAGRVLIILTDVIFLLVWALMVATCALSLYRNGNHLSVHLAIYDVCVIEPANLYSSVILCGYLYEFSHKYKKIDWY